MANNKRTGKFYRNNEKEVMKSLGLNPTPNSGSGWIVKEDGESEEIIAQLKSTDANSIRILKKDIDTLIYHSDVSHKIPLFIIQFLESHELYLLVRPSDLPDLSELLKGKKPIRNTFNDIDIEYGSTGGFSNGINKVNKSIKSSSNARKSFMKENDNKFRKKSKSAT